ncbi:MAG: agmatine deiminase family protein [Pseudomonadota bacterium]|uniref:agmatine deiminase family protein n=1 Tax=Gallaecimonas pentaromativorans TaxID=584787 RepID=UPI00067F4697|nr:agmatine deiminase family protein [Gallaecimonas pentaromativorans]MED5523898.1 agmatine deiminase family protein [Pseudomonadota bacterium]
MQRLLAEWEGLDGVLLTWPHKNTDWDHMLDEVIPLYEALAYVISDYADVLIAAPEDEVESIKEKLLALGISDDAFMVYGVPSNDTWARDHGPLTVETPEGLKLLDYTFTGWGNKFDAALDNQITARLDELGAFAVPVEQKALVLEGGAIEFDGDRTLLATSECLLNPNRNPHLTKEQIEAQLKADFGAEKINWLNHGYLAGDDTDSHIDTLARLCPNNVIAYVKCDDEQDQHFEAFQKMEAELEAMTDADGKPYKLVPLPWPFEVYDDEGQRLPATYANFLICNGAVLVPVYNDDRDEEALAAISEAFPGFDVVGLNCLPLIKQHGSLHCVTMQLPQGTLSLLPPGVEL